MANIVVEVESIDANSSRITSRPTLAQVKAVVDYMQKHPDLAQWKFRYGVSRHKFKKLWVELSNIVNSIDGAVKSTKGWIKFWSDKRRSVVIKQKQIKTGKVQGKLSALEQKILDLSDSSKATTRKKKKVKEEPCNGDNDSLSNIFPKEDDEEIDDIFEGENDERHLNIMEKLVNVMGQQASAIAQVAEAQMDHSRALERLAEASHIQALAVDRMAITFENMISSVHDVRNALMGIDYTMKRCYPTTATQQRQNTNIFS